MSVRADVHAVDCPTPVYSILEKFPSYKQVHSVTRQLNSTSPSDCPWEEVAGQGGAHVPKAQGLIRRGWDP